MTAHPLFRCLLAFVFAGGVGLALALPSAAQEKVEVTGTVVDSTGAGLGGATVVVVQAADSALVSFGVSRDDGAFRLRRVAPGAYLLQVTFIGFAPYSAPITVETADLDVGQITLNATVEGLDELVINAERIPMVVKEDTLEYNAAAFGTPANATVEDLLKRLPGMEVERDGTVKAQGETVQKVLVDGKEFFGNDPKIATKNLPADAIDKVQVFDKKSDTAEFTGVDDGEEAKTINLTLKEDRKNGYFGNVTGGLGGATGPGSEARYDSKLNLSRFSTGTQLSVIGNVNNINRQGFDFGDYISFMGGMLTFSGDDGEEFTAIDVPLGNSLSDGYSTTLSGGVNFNHEFTSKTELRSNYFVNYLDNEQERRVFQQQLFGETVSSLARQNADQSSRTMGHRLSADLKHTLGEGHDVRLRTNLRANTADLTNVSARETSNASGGLENNSDTRYTSARTGLTGDARLTYRLRVGKGRSIVADAQASLDDADLDGTLDATNRFFGNGNLLTTEEIAQLQEQRTNTFTHRQKLTYTEPLGSKRFLQFAAEHRAVQEDQDRNVFDRDGGALVRADSLSSAFERTYRYLLGGFTFRSNSDTRSFSAGLNVQQSTLDGAVVGAGAPVDRSYVHALPSASLRLDLGQGKNLNARYRASTREPSIRDLQPVVDNSDPLNVYVGNPGLRPEYSHRVGGGFMLFDQFTFTNFFVFLNATYTSSKISRARTIDAQFRQTVTPINTGGDWTVSGNTSFGTPIRKLGVKVNLSNNTVLDRGVEFINGDANRSRLLRSTLDVQLENREKERFDARVGTRYTFNDVAYSLNERLNQSYVNRSFYGELAWTPKGGWRLATKLDYALYANDVFGGGGQDVPLWEAELSKTFMNDKLQVQLVALDLLDQNVGVNYTNTNTYIQEERINSLGRYAMLKLVYSLTKGGSPRGGGINIVR